MRVLVVIPARNEENTISGVINGLRDAAPYFHRLVVNDASVDSMGRVLDEMGERQLRLPFNLGYGLALQTGFRFALEHGYDVVVSMDGDGQHRPEDTPVLVRELIDRDADVVIGSRYCDGRPYEGTMGRRVGQRLFSHVSRTLTGQRIYDTTSGFKALSARACRTISTGAFLDFHIETIVRLSILGYRIVEFPVEMSARVHGASMHTFGNAVRYPLKMAVLTVALAMDALLTRRKQ